MTRTRQVAVGLLALTVLAAGVGRVVHAHDGHEHKVMGTVTMAAADHVMLTDTDKKAVTVRVTAETKVTRSGKPMKAEEIAPGTRIVVTAVTEKDQSLTAHVIEVGVPPASR